MRALVWREPYRQEVTEVADPRPGPDDVLVAVRRAGICGSDVTAHRGLMGTARPGSIRGHEFAGVLHSSGRGPWPAGTRVSVNPVITCGDCARCSAGRSSTCPSLQILGVHRPGAFAELVAVPIGQIHRMPDGLGWDAAASAEPLAQARHDVRRAAELAPLGRCAVIGAGSIGLGIVHALRLEGAETTTVVDPDPERHLVAATAGAVRGVTSTEHLAGEAFDTVFDVVGAPATRRAALSLVRAGGTVVAVGLGADEAAVSWFDVVRREITVRGASALVPEDFRVALDWLAGGLVSAPAVRRRVTLERAPAVFDMLARDGGGNVGKTFIDPGRPRA